MNLIEWIDKQGNTINFNNTTAPNSSKTFDYSDKFKAMLNYHINHNSSLVVDYKIELIDSDRFHYKETVNDSNTTVDKDVVGVIDKNGNWLVVVLLNGEVKQHLKGIESGIKDLIESLAKANVFFFPPVNSKEYQDLITEAFSIADEFKLYENLWEN